MEKVDFEELKQETAAMVYRPASASLHKSNEIPSEAKRQLLAIEGVKGVGLSGEEKLSVYVVSDKVRERLPKTINNFKVVAETVGEVKFLAP